MKFIKLDLLTLLISLFLFASCENASTIGLEIDPNSAVEGTLVDTLTVTSRTMMDDVTSTAGLARHPLGILNDPIFGRTESSLAMSVGIPSTTHTFGTNPTLDSAVLVLNYGGEFYGDSTHTYTIDVHQLTDNFASDEKFLSTKVYPHNNQLVGTKTGRLFPTTKFKVTDLVTGGKDTLKSVSPQIRIRLDNAFITENIVSLAASDLKNNLTFKNLFKGLHVSVNPTGLSGNGAMMFIDLASTNSNLSLYYKKQGTTAALIDTVNINFPMGENTSIGPVNLAGATIKHTYTGTPVQTQLDNPNQQYLVTYLQPLAGLRNKISFPTLEKFSTTTGNIVVNKAELVIDVSAGTDIKPFETAPRLALYRYDIAEQRKAVEVYGGETEAIGGYFDSTKKQYVFNVTAYVQNLVSKKTKDYGTFIGPIPRNEFSINPSLSSASRVVIGAYKKNASAGDNVMKLNIYYTKVN
ncbi:DUF4270 domain-containing protein [Pedobacter insulae]|uniref:DUF4270 domain-containing protein n=1 Tax=Pedobacter insulae TaxID=414048 RepID=A0A1I2YR32_9SPHI|nr:DUF4270 domain-containing protein [Pedobacter insulae]SFH27985.1 protein of unknown function [Pedobacter insulae]